MVERPSSTSFDDGAERDFASRAPRPRRRGPFDRLSGLLVVAIVILVVAITWIIARQHLEPIPPARVVPTGAP